HTTTNLFLGGSPDNGGTNGTGTYALVMGTLTVNQNAYVGYNDTSLTGSTFNQGYDPVSGQTGSGSNTVNISDNLYIGGGPSTTAANSTGTYNLYDGTLTVSGNTYVGYSGTGTFTQGLSTPVPVATPGGSHT